MSVFSKKSNVNSLEVFSEHEDRSNYLSGFNGANSHSPFDLLLNGLQTSFFARTNPNAGAVISTATSPYASTLFPAMSIGPSVAEKADATATTLTKYTLAVGQTARGEIASKGDHDYYQVALVAGQTYTFAQIGTGVNSLQDPFLAIVNASGKRVASNDDSGPGSSALLTYKPTASGNYFIDAGAFNNGSTGQYGVSVTAGTKASFDIEMGAGALDSYTTWGSLSTASAVNVTYSFRSSAPTTYTPPANFSALTSQQIIAVQDILKLWSDVAQVTFTQIIDTTIGGVTQYSNNGTIAIANYSASDGAGAFAYYPGSTAATSSAGDLWLNLSGGVTTSGVTAGTYPFFAIMHEFGHALGLSHPGDYNAGAGGVITYSGNAQFVQDTEMYSVMSYFGGSYTGEGPGTTAVGDNRPGAFATAYTPMLLDIYALQQLYGANTTTRTSDTTYGFGANNGAEYSFSMTNSIVPQFCIWDAGGTDTLNCSGYSNAQNISLIAGTFSSVDGGTNNVSIALNCVIENAIGGAGNDVIVANSTANILTGGSGSDIFRYFSANDSNSSALDKIMDFVSGKDTLDLSVIDANTGVAGDQAFAFINGAFTSSAGQLRFDSGSNQVQADMNGDAVVDFAVTLVGITALFQSDIVL